MKISIISDDMNFLGLQIFDCLDAYLQNMEIDHQIRIIKKPVALDPKSVNIRFLNMPLSVDNDLGKYDLIIVDNADESSEVLTKEIIEILNKFENSFFLCNSYVSSDHPQYKRWISLISDWDLTLKYFTNRFYPQAHATINKDVRKGRCVFINGSNRKFRNYFANKILGHVPVISNLSNLIPDSDVEYDDNSWQDVLGGNTLYDQQIPIGTQEKFGKLVLSFFPLSEYSEYLCVAFPETGFTNNELTITEKITKCFHLGAIPFPIGGANICRLYNELGFKTAHDLLPQEMTFDHIQDHKERLDRAADTLIWLNKNEDILESEQARDMIINNKINFYQNRRLDRTMEKLYNAIKICQTKKN